MTAAIPAEHEFLEVDVGVLPPQPVIDPHRPSLQIGKDAVDVLQDMMGLDVFRQHVLVVKTVRQMPVGRVAVGHDDRALIGVAQHEGGRSSRP